MDKDITEGMVVDRNTLLIRVPDKGISGQTAVEYIFMTAMLAMLVFTIGGKIRNFFIGPNGECPSDAYICKIIKIATGDGALGGDYRYFTLRK